MANVLVYLVAWAILNRSSNEMICPDDAYAFRNLMLVCISIGAAASIAYHLLVKFPNDPGKFKLPKIHIISLETVRIILII